MPTITNLKNYVWHANPTFTGFPSEQKDYDIHYHSDSILYTHIVFKTNAIDYVRENPSSQPTAYSSTSGWDKENYRTIRIIDGTDLENTELITLLEANGTLEPYVITLDLTTIGLDLGTHSIQTSASDDEVSGLKDSDLSAPLQYTPGYNITVITTNCSQDSTNPRMINPDETAELHFIFDGTSYVCPETAPTVTGANVDAWQKVDDTHGTLVISTATGAVGVTVEGEKAPWDGTDLTGTTWKLKIDYVMPGSRICKYVYNINANIIINDSITMSTKYVVVEHDGVGVPRILNFYGPKAGGYYTNYTRYGYSPDYTATAPVFQYREGDADHYNPVMIRSPDIYVTFVDGTDVRDSTLLNLIKTLADIISW